MTTYSASIVPRSVTTPVTRPSRWVMPVTQTPEENLRRLDIEIFPLNALDGDPLARLSGFLNKP